jgi:hypothetical protein
MSTSWVSAPLKDSVVVFLVMSGNNLFQSLMVCTNENINSLEKIQRRAARYTCNRHYNTSSVSEMLNTMNWHSTRTRLIMFHGRLRLWHLDILRVEQILIYGHACCSKSGLNFSWLLFSWCYTCLGERTSLSNHNKTQIRILLHCLGSSHKRKHKLARKDTATGSQVYMQQTS